ncbi:MAG TPA: ATP-binding protein [Polyangiales bacterium]
MPSEWPQRGGEMGARIRAFDWAATSLGPTHTWPRSLRAVVELMLASPQPTYIGWSSDVISLFNDGYIPILGAKHAQALGRPYAQVWPEIWDEYRPVVEATLKGTSHYFVDQPVALEGRDGLPLSWFTFSWTPLRNDQGEISGFFCSAIETTQKMQAEQKLRASKEAALRASEDRYRTLFDAIDEGFCIIEMLFEEDGRPCDYRFIEANQAFERQTGLVGAEGHTIRELVPSHEQHWFDVYGRVVRTGESTRFEDVASGLGRFYDVFAFRVGPPEWHRVAVLFNDITAKKQAEQALLEADRRKDEFLATLAHELRNPLAPLRTGLHLARLQTEAEHALQRVFEMMERQLSHMVRLVDDLMDVGRISSGKLTLQTRELTLHEVLASSVEATSDLLRQRRHRLVLKQQQADVRLVGDFDRLSQVFTNLLSNAAKYTEQGGEIRVCVAREAGEVIVRVSDNGIGIPEANLAQVFDLFSQVRAHQGMNAGGLGIGLALVKRLVSLHAGHVEAASQGPGRGSTFTVRLPTLAPLPADTPKSELRASSHQARKRIVVADDNEDSVVMLAELFKFLGHDVWTANDGAEALERAIEVQPDVVVLDLGMPRMDGFEAAKRIRGTPAGRSALLVALTGWGQDRDRQRTREAGFDTHLVKPVDPAALSALLAGRTDAEV